MAEADKDIVWEQSEPPNILFLPAPSLAFSSSRECVCAHTNKTVSVQGTVLKEKQGLQVSHEDGE